MLCFECWRILQDFDILNTYHGAVRHHIFLVMNLQSIQHINCIFLVTTMRFYYPNAIYGCSMMFLMISISCYQVSKYYMLHSQSHPQQSIQDKLLTVKYYLYEYIENALWLFESDTSEWRCASKYLKNSGAERCFVNYLSMTMSVSGSDYVIWKYLQIPYFDTLISFLSQSIGGAIDHNMLFSMHVVHIANSSNLTFFWISLLFTTL